MKRIYKCCNKELEYKWRGLIQYVKCPFCKKEKVTGKILFPVKKIITSKMVTKERIVF